MSKATVKRDIIKNLSVYWKRLSNRNKSFGEILLEVQEYLGKDIFSTKDEEILEAIEELIKNS